MIDEVLLDVEIARGFHVDARVAVPDDARGTVACVNPNDALAEVCTERGFAVVQTDLTVTPEAPEGSAAVFADVVKAVVADRAIFDRPVGYFGVGLGGVAALIGASLYPNDVASVVTLNAPLHLTGTHLSGVRAATLLLVDSEDGLATTPDALPPLPAGSTQVLLIGDDGADAKSASAEWFDRTLRGVMRGARRELWRSA